MGKTSIEWTDASWNPLRARDRSTGELGHYCEKISDGCAHCYASAFQPRFGLPLYTGPSHRAERLGGLELLLDLKTLAAPLRWRKPHRVFVCSMTDLFLDAYPDLFLNQVFAVMALGQRHTFQVLTKRPERMRDYLWQVAAEKDMNRWELAAREMGYTMEFEGEWVGPDWPLPNVWLGVSVENQQRADERIPLLLQTPAAIRFLSCEPLLGPIDLQASFHRAYAIPETRSIIRPLDWCIIGGESGPSARPCDLAWVRALVAQCREAGVACFVKQLGARPFEMRQDPTYACEHEEERPLRLRNPKGGAMEEWPEDLRIRQFPEVPHA